MRASHTEEGSAHGRGPPSNLGRGTGHGAAALRAGGSQPRTPEMPLVDHRRRTVPPPRTPSPAPSSPALSHAHAPTPRDARTKATWRVRHILLSDLNAIFSQNLFSSPRPLLSWLCAAAIVAAADASAVPPRRSTQEWGAEGYEISGCGENQWTIIYSSSCHHRFLLTCCVGCSENTSSTLVV